MSWDNDEPIGYGKPPRWTQFQKGQSGNPNGRPRRATPKPSATPAASEQDDILRRALERQVEITEGGKKRLVPMKEVIQLKQVGEAAKGGITAMRDVLRSGRELEASDRQRALERAALDEQVFVHIAAWRTAQNRAWQRATAEGREPTQPWPHPDDFIIDERARRWSIRGPSKVADVPVFEALRADREVHQMRLMLEMSRQRPRQAMIDFNVAALAQYDAMLPKRWQIDVDQWQAQAKVFLDQPPELLDAAVASVERRAASFVRPTLAAADRRANYQATNKAMRPLLQRQGYRSLKQFEAAFAARGNALPWPKVT